MIKIRKARLNDVEEITQLQALLMRHHIRLDKYWEIRKDASKIFSKFARKVIKSKNSVIFVAEDNGKIIGYALGTIAKRAPIFKIFKFGHFMDAFVLEDYRKTGVGSRLTYELLKWFKRKGMRYVELEVDIKNKIGVKVWGKLGFKKHIIKMKINI